ncbi:hypothetical protein [Thermaurantiacus sp.]
MEPRPKGAPQKPHRPQPGQRRASPWREGTGAHADRIATEDDRLCAALSGPFQGLPSALVERRLIRRAETLWDELRGERPMPPATALASFSGAGFADYSLLFAPADRAGQEELRLLRTGPALAALLGSHPATGAPPAWLLSRLAALAATAATSGRPVGLELGPGQGAEDQGRAELLLRAIALPFARSPGAMPGRADVRAAVLVLVSWRQLLSAEETQALHRELADAFERLHQSDC